MKIRSFGIKFGKNPFVQFTVERQAPAAETKSSSEYEKLWAIGEEMALIRGESVTRPYEEVASVYKAVKAIADNVPQADMAVFKMVNGERTNDARLEKLLRRPNPMQSGNDFMQEVAGTYALYGEVFIWKRPSMGQIAGTVNLPAELYVINPSDMTEVVDKTTGLVTTWKRGSIAYPAAEIIHIKDFNPYNRYRGMSPTKPLKNEIDIDAKSMLFNKKFFDNDATPGMTLTTDNQVSDKAFNRIMEWWKKNFQGVKRAFSPMLLEGGLKPANVTPTHKDMDFIEQKKHTREEILGTFRSPKALFNITEALNYATFTGQMKIFWVYVLIPMMKKIEDSFNAHMIEPYNADLYFAFDLSQVPAFQEDFKEKVTTGKTLFDMGFTANEINDKLGLGFEEADWRDEWWINFGMVPASEAGKVPDGGSSAGNGTQPAKSHEPTEKDAVALAAWKTFLAKQAPLEKRFESKMSRFFYDQRKRVLAGMNESNMSSVDHMLDWDQENENLKKMATPFLKQGVTDGMEIAQNLLKKKDTSLNLEDSMLSHKVNSYLAMRADKITGINRTTKARIANTLTEGIASGETVTQLQDRVKETFNMMASRARLIARTETAGAVNGGSLIYYDANGVAKKEWVTAGDEHVRESHRAINHEVRRVGDNFDNGLKYPGDQSSMNAGETVNCRCTLLPVIY